MKKSTKGNKTLKIIKAAAAVIAVLAVAAACIYFAAAIKNDIAGSSDAGEEYTLVIKESDFQYQVAEKLAGGGIVVSSSLWSLWMDKNYPDFTYINGEYYMSSSMSYEEIAEKLQNPDISHKTVSVCIPEGYNVFDIAETLEENNICSAEDFYAAVSTTDYDYDWLSDLPSENENIGFILEGFLFPATYDIGENTAAADVVDKMLAAFDSHYTSDMREYCEENEMTLWEFITLCSIVQEEALSYDSASNIASVLINRLESGTKLQCDVTYYYAKKLLDYGCSQDVYDSYYTYRCPALPAGPITNCGDEIISAVINHADTDYMFFFSDLEGEFHFAETAAEFEALKEQYPWK
ncbi:MAG: endolytic transglycosylase MltG [Clostridiales bacterium]|nr:endolytic transglycosylase MltG [Clostridiales bacterium]